MSTRSLIASISSVFVIAATLVLAVPAMASSSDADHDGMSNRWEVRYHLDARRPNALADADHDGLANLAEFRLGTNPRDKDSDNDGTFDGLEDFDDDGSTTRTNASSVGSRPTERTTRTASSGARRWAGTTTEPSPIPRAGSERTRVSRYPP